MTDTIIIEDTIATIIMNHLIIGAGAGGAGVNEGIGDSVVEVGVGAVGVTTALFSPVIAKREKPFVSAEK